MIIDREMLRIGFETEVQSSRGSVKECGQALVLILQNKMLGTVWF